MTIAAIGMDKGRLLVCGMGPTVDAAKSDAETLTPEHMIDDGWLLAVLNEGAARVVRAGNRDASGFVMIERVNATTVVIRVHRDLRVDP